MKPHAQPGGVDPDPVGQPRIDAGHRELHEAYAQQRSIVHALGASSPDFIYIFDRAQRFIYVSPPLLRLWQRTPEEAVGKTFAELGYDPALVALHTRQLDEALTGKTISGSNAYVSPAGVEGQYEYTFVPVVGADGQVVTVVGTTRDVTARLRAERERVEVAERAAVEEKKLAREREAVRAALHEIEELVHLSPVPTVVFRGPDHVYALVNAAHDRMFRKRVVGKTIREAHTKEEAGQVPEILDRVYRTGEPFVSKAVHYSVRGEDGRARSIWVHEWFSPMRDVVGVLGVAQEVTEEVRARREVSTVLNAIPAFVTRVNTEGRFVFISQSNAQYFGPTEKILGRTMKEYFGADYDFFADKVDAALRGE